MLKGKMVSKRLLLVSLCFVILLAAVGAYSYVEITRLDNHISDFESQVDSLQNTVSSLEDEKDSLQGQVDALQEEIDQLQNEISHLNSTGNFVFQWPFGLRMELNFSWVDNNLSIIAKLNDPIDLGMSGLGLFFDKDGDGEIRPFEPGFVLYSDNGYHPAWLGENGFPIIPLTMPTQSPYHTCTFEPGVGYTYKISLPIRDKLHNDLIHIAHLYLQACVQFHFGLEV